jgi:signal-transduction protein with cAMP-binding, CBS, and nucleotidyltransferase domain
MKLSRRGKKVKDIVLPLKGEIPLYPSVTMTDLITLAIELMVKNNRKKITVVQNNRQIGMVRLADAFQKVGLLSAKADKKRK